MAKTKAPAPPGISIRKKRHEVYLKMVEILEGLDLPDLKPQIVPNYSEKLIQHIYVNILGSGKRLELFSKMEKEIKKAISQEDVPYEVAFQSEILISIKASKVQDINFDKFLGSSVSEKQKKDPGRPFTEFGLFQKNMIEFIENNSVLKHKSNPGFYLIPNNSDSEKRVIIKCGIDNVVNKVLLALEKNSHYADRIVSVDKKEILVSESKQPSNFLEKYSFVFSFTSKIEKEAKESIHSLKLERDTAIFNSVNRAGDVFIKYLFQNENDANIFVTRLINTIGTKQDGKVVRLQANLEAVKKCLTVRLLNPPQSYEQVKVQKTGLVTKEVNLKVNPNPHSYVMSSADYDDFHFLKFNRNRSKEHTMEIVESVKRHGVLSFVTVVITDCIDGTVKKWVVDGQHRFDAFRFLGLPILYTVAVAHSKKEIVRLIADLNKTSRRWVTKNFLHAWETLEIEDYSILRETLERTRLPITLLFEVFSGRERTTATKLFQDGDFDIVNKSESLRYISYIMDLKGYLPRSRELFSRLVSFFKKTPDYDHNVLRRAFASEVDIGDRLATAGYTREQTVFKINKIYEQYKRAS